MSKFDVDEMIQEFIDGQELLKGLKGEYNKTKFIDQIRKINSELEILEEMMKKDFDILNEIKLNLELLKERYDVNDSKLTSLQKSKIYKLIVDNLPEGLSGKLNYKGDTLIILKEKEVGKVEFIYKDNINYVKIKMEGKNNGEYKEFLLNPINRIYKIILYIFTSLYK